MPRFAAAVGLALFPLLACSTEPRSQCAKDMAEVERDCGTAIEDYYRCAAIDPTVCAAEEDAFMACYFDAAAAGLSLDALTAVDACIQVAFDPSLEGICDELTGACEMAD